MAIPPSLDPGELEQLQLLHAAGKGRNDIARALQRSGSTISKAAEELGLTFDRSRIAAATAARLADAKASRAELQQMYLEEAQELLLEVRRPVEYVDHGGKDFVEVRWTMPEPSIADKLKLLQSSGISTDRALKLAQHDAESGVEPVKSMLGQLAEYFGVGMPKAQDPDGPPNAD